MNCPKEDCKGTLRMCYLTTTSTTIKPSYLYVCDKCFTPYVLKPEKIDPQKIADGRDQVLLYLEEQLYLVEHEQVQTPMHDKSGFMGTKGNNQAYIDLETNRKHIQELIKARRTHAPEDEE